MYNLGLRPSQRFALAFSTPVFADGACTLQISAQGVGGGRVFAGADHRIIFGGGASGYVANFGSGASVIPIYKSSTGVVAPIGGASALFLTAHGAGFTSVTMTGAVTLPIVGFGQDARINGIGETNKVVSAGASGVVAVQGVGSGSAVLHSTASGVTPPAASATARVVIAGAGRANVGNSAVGIGTVKMPAAAIGARGSVLVGSARITLRGSGKGAGGNNGVGQSVLPILAVGASTTMPVFSGSAWVALPLIGVAYGEHPKNNVEFDALFVRTHQPSLAVMQ